MIDQESVQNKWETSGLLYDFPFYKKLPASLKLEECSNLLDRTVGVSSRGSLMDEITEDLPKCLIIPALIRVLRTIHSNISVFIFVNDMKYFYKLTLSELKQKRAINNDIDIDCEFVAAFCEYYETHNH